MLITETAEYFDTVARAMAALPLHSIAHVTEALLKAYEAEQMVYLFGNGGSAALASHLACDLGKGTVNGNGKRFRVVALTDNIPLMTAWANDSHYHDIFAEQLINLVTPGDVAFAISASGNSPNVLRGLEVAKEAGAVALGLTGFHGGRVKELCEVCVIIPSDNMQVIEDLHLSVAHAVFTAIRKRICRAKEACA